MSSSIEDTLRIICQDDGRMVGSPGHRRVRDFLKGFCVGKGLKPFRGQFGIPYGDRFENVVGVLPGKDRSLPPVLLGAHYDSVIAAQCADDNGAALSAIIELVRYIEPGEYARDIVVAFFDAEEPPYFMTPQMGSRRFVEDHCQNMEFRLVIILDLVGHPVSLPPSLGGTDLAGLTAILGNQEGLSRYCGELQKCTYQGSVPMIYGPIDMIPPLSDYAAFDRAGHPVWFLTSGQGEHYHRTTDTIDWVDKEKISGLCGFLKCALTFVASAAIRSSGTAAYVGQAGQLRTAFGPWYEPLCAMAGVDPSGYGMPEEDYLRILATLAPHFLRG